MKSQYTKAVNRYVKAFSKKHGLELEFWVSDNPGTIAYMSDYYIGFEDMRHDIDEGIEKGKFFEWYDYGLEHYEHKGYNVSYVSYLKGFNHA